MSLLTVSNKVIQIIIITSPLYNKGVNYRFPHVFDLSLFPTLRSFSLDLRFSESNYDMLLLKSLKLFSMVSGRCSIHDIVITMRWTVINPDRITDIFSSGDDWRSFDEVITSSRFPFLANLSLKFDLEYPDHHPPFHHVSAKLSDGIRSSLPAISTSESISFVVDIQMMGVGSAKK